MASESRTPLTAIVKIDIEGGECDAILGSMKALSMDKKVMYIPIIIMEWIFRNPKIQPLCPVEKLKAMAEVLSAAGYIPFSKGRTKRLDPKNAVGWPETNSLDWIHKDSAFYRNIQQK